MRFPSQSPVHGLHPVGKSVRDATLLSGSRTEDLGIGFVESRRSRKISPGAGQAIGTDAGGKRSDLQIANGVDKPRRRCGAVRRGQEEARAGGSESRRKQVQEKAVAGTAAQGRKPIPAGRQPPPVHKSDHAGFRHARDLRVGQPNLLQHVAVVLAEFRAEPADLSRRLAELGHDPRYL